MERFRANYPHAQVEVRRVLARQIPQELLSRSIDFGVLTFQPRERSLLTVPLGEDELVVLTHPDHPLSKRSTITMEEFGQQTVIAHNEASPARERVLRLYEQSHTSLNIQIDLPSIDGIKRAVELNLGVALLPKRCALSEISRGQLVAIKVPPLRLARQVQLVYRREGEMSHAAEAFLNSAKSLN